MSASSGSDEGLAANAAPPVLHRPILSLHWTAEEEKILEEALRKYPKETCTGLGRYMRVAAMLPEKSTRDVAVKLKLVSAKQQQQQPPSATQSAAPTLQPQIQENAKRRKGDEATVPSPAPIATKKKEKKDKSMEMKPVLLQGPGPPIAIRPTMPSAMSIPMPSPMYCPRPPLLDNEDTSSYDAIGGTAGKLLKHNDELIGICRSNFFTGKVMENVELLCQLRDNVMDILNGMTSMPGIMSQMPPLPVKLNVEICEQILPKRVTPPTIATTGPVHNPPPTFSAQGNTSPTTTATATAAATATTTTTTTAATATVPPAVASPTATPATATTAAAGTGMGMTMATGMGTPSGSPQERKSPESTS